MTESTPAVSQEIEATTEYVSAELDGNPIRVRVVQKWRPSYLRALRSGDADTWAAGVIHADDLPLFTEADPTFEEIGEFANRAMEAAGEAPGKSGRPSTTSTRTRKK